MARPRGSGVVTVHALVVDPLRPGLALPDLVSGGPFDEGTGLDPDAAVTLSGAMVRDAAVAVERSGGELLVNHPTEDQLPEGDRGGADPAAELRDLLDGAVADVEAVRFEPQVGGSFEARVGNTVTHLLREEGATSVAVLDARAPTLDRAALDSAAMKLRRSEAVLGPAPGGGVAYLGLTDPVDFEGAWRPPALETLAGRAVQAGHDVDFLPMHPRVDGVEGLATLVSLVEARRAAGRRVPEYTAAAIDDLGLRVDAVDGSTHVLTGSTDRA